MLEEVLERNLHEDRLRTHRRRSIREQSDGLSEDASAMHAEHRGIDREDRPDGNRAPEGGLEPAGHRRGAEQPVQGTQYLVHSGGEHSTVCEARCPLMVLTDREGTMHRELLPGGDRQVQSGSVIGPAAEAPAVMRGDRCTCRRGTWIALRDHRTVGHGHGMHGHTVGQHEVMAIETAPVAVRYRERVMPGLASWLAALGFVLLIAIAYAAAFDAYAGWLLAAGGILIVAIAQYLRSISITVSDDGAGAGAPVGLHVGDAHLPVRAIASVEVLDATAVRASLGPDTDVRTYTAVLGSAGRGGVLIRLADPEDPHPAWLVSSRRPAALAAAINELVGG